MGAILPQEIIDKIFLLTDYETLYKTRALQSDYVKKITDYSYMEAIKYGNLECIKKMYKPYYRLEEDYPFLDNFLWSGESVETCSLIEAAAAYNKIDIVKWSFYNDERTNAYRAIYNTNDIAIEKWLLNKLSPEEKEDYEEYLKHVSEANSI